MAKIWEDLMKDKYPTTRTPKELVKKLKMGRKAGSFTHGKYWNQFNVVREDSSAWVVSTERGSAGGHY